MNADHATYAEMMEDADHQRPDDLTVLEAIYETYEAEGHLVLTVCLTPDDPETESWIAKCTCGESSGFDDGPRDDEGRPARVMTFIDMRWWARGHRTEHGLGWQKWMPAEPLERVKGQEYAHEGHCVMTLHLPTKIAAICTCSMGDGEMVEDVNVFKSEQQDEVRAWADEHRVRHGLPPQELLPPMGMLYSPPKGD